MYFYPFSIYSRLFLPSNNLNQLESDPISIVMILLNSKISYCLRVLSCTQKIVAPLKLLTILMQRYCIGLSFQTQLEIISHKDSSAAHSNK